MKYLIGDKVKTANAGNGVVCHISGGVDYVHVRTEKHGVVFVHVESLTKLPKYAVGDVVRFKHKKGKNPTVIDKYGFIATIKSCHYDACTLYEYPETYFDRCFEPFDGFRIGDTVWTVKRGKGKIIGNVYDNTKRPFAVDFSAPLGSTLKWYTYDGIFYPKLTNLIPTEAKYKEAIKLQKITVVGESFLEVAKSVAAAFGRTAEQLKKFPSGGVVYQCPPIPEHLIGSREPIKFQVAPSSKFKEGDVVYLKNIPFTPHGVAFPHKYVVNKFDGKYLVTSQDNQRSTWATESDLRLWKETEFEILVDDGITLKSCAGFSQPFCYDEVRFIGKTQEGKDIFSAKTKSMAHTHIFYGTKGDDI